MANKKFSFAAITLTSLVFLAACTAVSSPNNQAVNDQTQKNRPEYTETDTAAMKAAMELNDPSYCEKMSEATFTANCKMQLADETHLNAALEKMDATFCMQLSTQDKQEACKIEVEAAVEVKLKRDTWNMEVALSNEIVQTLDFGRCRKELKNPDMIERCEFDVSVNKASDSGDLSWCEKNQNPEKVKSCKDLAQ